MNFLRDESFSFIKTNNNISLMEQYGRLILHDKRRIPNNVVSDHPHKYFNGRVMQLYEYIFDGNEVEFDLHSTSVRFVMGKTGEIKHKNKFIRGVKCTAERA